MKLHFLPYAYLREKKLILEWQGVANHRCERKSSVIKKERKKEDEKRNCPNKLTSWNTVTVKDGFRAACKQKRTNQMIINYRSCLQKASEHQRAHVTGFSHDIIIHVCSATLPSTKSGAVLWTRVWVWFNNERDSTIGPEKNWTSPCPLSTLRVRSSPIKNNQTLVTDCWIIEKHS